MYAGRHACESAANYGYIYLAYIVSHFDGKIPLLLPSFRRSLKEGR